MCPPILMYIPIPTSKLCKNKKNKKKSQNNSDRSQTHKMLSSLNHLGGGCYNTALRCLIII